MSVYCDKCHARKVLAEENALACPKCNDYPSEPPQLCDYCHARVATVPSDRGTWICDVCIKEAIIATSKPPIAQVPKDNGEVQAPAS